MVGEMSKADGLWGVAALRGGVRVAPGSPDFMHSLEVMEDARSNLAKEIQQRKATKKGNVDFLESYLDSITFKIDMLQTSVATGSITPAGASALATGLARASEGSRGHGWGLARASEDTARGLARARESG